MFTRRVVLILCAAAVVAAFAGTTSQASPPLSVTNNLTFGSTVALPGVTLPAGTYVFERDIMDNTRIVRVKSANYQKLLFVGFTIAVKRPPGLRAPVSFGEAVAGEPIPIVAWYPVGSDQGHQFLYR